MNLKRTKKNFVLTKDLEELWLPYVVFFNIESLERKERSEDGRANKDMEGIEVVTVDNRIF